MNNTLHTISTHIVCTVITANCMIHTANSILLTQPLNKATNYVHSKLQPDIILRCLTHLRCVARLRPKHLNCNFTTYIFLVQSYKNNISVVRASCSPTVYSIDETLCCTLFKQMMVYCALQTKMQCIVF